MPKALFVTLCIMVLSLQHLYAQDAESEIRLRDTISYNPLRPLPAIRDLKRDTTMTLREKLIESKNIFVRFIKAFDEYDTTYIEPNRYNMTAMLQGTGTAEWFSLRGEESKSVMGFTSRPGYKIGPYIGWRFIFIGYTMDVRTMAHERTKKTEFELSLYSSMLGADLIYRKTGSDFTLSRSRGFDQDLSAYYGMGFDGIKVALTGLNVYYIQNRKQFSLPAAFSQSTRQLRSAGSWKFGFSVTRHSIDIDYNKLNEQIPGGVSQDMEVSKLKYMDYSLSAGYAYNWVPKKDWLFSIDFAPSLGYKRTNRNVWMTEQVSNPSGTKNEERLYNIMYERGNFNFNVTGRVGVIWNNSRNYAGASLVLHNFNYRYKELSMHNTFITFNLYTGMNFWKKKKK